MTLSALVALAERRGLQPTDLNEIVYETAASRASVVNNNGLKEQLRFLVEQYGKKEAERIIRTGGKG